MGLRSSLLGLLGALCLAAPALAANCPSFTYTLTNGTTADANQVMANFNTLLNCSNNNLAHSGTNNDITTASALTSAPNLVLVTGNGALLSANNLSDLASASTARTNLGLGSAALKTDGTTGAVYCLLNANCTYSGTNTYQGNGTYSGANTFSGSNSFTNTNTFSGPVVISNTVASAVRYHEYETSGSLRWIGGVTNDVESGSNVGTNFAFCRYSDTAVFLDCPLEVIRASGLVEMLDGLTVSGALTATLTGNASTATALQTGRTIATSGDDVCAATSFNGSANITLPCTLPTVNSNVGTFTNATVTVNAKGQVTAASTGAAGPTSAEFNNAAAGETLTISTWSIRTLGSTVLNNIAGASLSGNRVTLPAGTYTFVASSSMTTTVSAGAQQIRLYNFTDSVAINTGVFFYEAVNTEAGATMQGTFTLAGSKALEIDSFANPSGTGQGVDITFVKIG